MLKKLILIGLFFLKRTKKSSARVGKAIVPSCFFFGQLQVAKEFGSWFLHWWLQAAQETMGY